MAPVLQWLRRWFGGSPARSATVEPTASAGDAVRLSLGPVTQRHLERVADLLSIREREQLHSIGALELSLRAAHHALRDPSRGAGRVAVLAEACRREIDLVLSEPDGVLVRALRELPSRSVHGVAGARQQVASYAGPLIAQAHTLIATVEVAGPARVRARQIRSRFESQLPTVCEALGLSGLERRLEDASTPQAVARLGDALTRCEELLAARHTALVAEVAEFTSLLHASVASADLAVPGGDLEHQVRSLRTAFAEAARHNIVALGDRTEAAAEQHLTRLATGGAATAFESIPLDSAASSSAPPGRPTALLTDRWVKLRAFRPVRPTPQGAARQRKKRKLKPGALDALRSRAASDPASRPPADAAPERVRRPRGAK